MTAQFPPIQRLVPFAILVLTALLVPHQQVRAAQGAEAIYRGDVPAGSGPARKIELRLKADGSMVWLTDYRNNRAPIIEEGRWNPISLEDIEVILERKNGQAINPTTVLFVKQGDTLRTSPGSSAEFGPEGLTLKRTKVAAIAAAGAPTIGALTPVGLAWKWEGLITPAEKIAVDPPDRYTLELQSGGKALVRADCNRGQAAYKLDGRGINIKVMELTKATCPPGSLSGRYLKALETAVGQRVKGDNLFLDLPGEGGTMVFVRAR
jgi:heat shock protein HslJ